mgnify:CR=1 FL=1
MTKEPEFKRGEKGFLKRFVNIFQSDAKIALEDFKLNSDEAISKLNGIKISLENEVSNIMGNIASLEEKESDLQMKLDVVSNFYTSNFKENENGVIISEVIDGYVEKFKEYKAEIDELKIQINDYKGELFGTEDEEGNEIKGLDHQIDSLKIQLQDSIKESEGKLNEFLRQNGKKRDELFTRIEGLLKGASTVALAKAFKEHKDSFITSNYIWITLFVASIISMMALSVWGFVNANYEFKDMWKYTLGNFPFIGGAIWLAIYSSKQRSQNKRLQQEYAFKEDVAKIYYGLKEEVEELGDTKLGVKLNESVLKLVIDVVSLNPSESLDSKYHTDNGPILESIKNLGEVVKNIKNST